MPENFDFLEDGKYEVRLVRNFLLDKKRDGERRNLSPAFHIILAVIGAFLCYIAMDGPSFGLGTLSVICLLAGPALASFTLLYGSKACRIILASLPPVIYALRLTFSGKMPQTTEFSSQILTFFLFTALYILFSLTVIKGYTKSACLVAATTLFALVMALQVCLAFISANGKVSLNDITKAIDTTLESVKTEAVETLDKTATEEELIEIFSYKEGTKKTEILKDFRKSLDVMMSALKMFLPAIFVLSSLAYGFIAVAVFGAVSQKFKLNTFVCIMDEKWIYRPSTITATVYNGLLLIFVLSMFVSFSDTFNIAVQNLFVIMTPFMFLQGLRAIYTMLLAKNKRRVKSGVITAVIVTVGMLILSFTSIFFVSTIGTSFIKMRERAEKYTMPEKIAKMKEMYQKNDLDFDTDTTQDA